MAALRPFLLPLIALVFLASALSLGLRWRAEPQILRKQANFLRAVEDRKPKRVAALLAEDYEDQWGFDHLNALRACDDLRQYFLVLELRPGDAATTIEGRTAVHSARIRVFGTPVGPGTLIRQEANRLDTPFTFTWEKQSLLPWSWRMTAMGNEGLPGLHGYDPRLGLDVFDSF